MISQNSVNIFKIFLLSTTTGIIGYSGIFYWLIPTFKVAGEHFLLGLLAMLILSFYCSIYLFLFCLFLVYFKKYSKTKILFLLGSASLWVIMEYIRGHLFSGFPWMLLGYSQYNNLPIIQIAEFSGVYGVSFLIILINLTISIMLKQSIEEKKIIPPQTAKLFILISVIISLVLLYGKYTIHKIKNKKPNDKNLTIVILQGNIDQYKKWDKSFVEEIIAQYTNLVYSAYYKILKDKNLHNNAILWLWPESSVPGWLFEEKYLFSWVSELVKTTNQKIKSYHLVGTVRTATPLDIYYNSAVLLSFKNDEVYVEKIYDKIHLVPFGEYIPFRPLLSKFVNTVNQLGEFTAGKNFTVFSINSNNINFSTLICYESIFPELTKKFVDSGAEFVVNITNDAWYLKTSAPYQHFIFNIFRAVENRCYLFRAANTGISGVISPIGEVLNKTNLFEPEYIVANVPIWHKKTFYTKYGDMLWIFYVSLFLFCFLVEIIVIPKLFIKCYKISSGGEPLCQ